MNEIKANLRLAFLQNRATTSTAQALPRPCEGERTGKTGKDEIFSADFEGSSVYWGITQVCRRYTHSPAYACESTVFDGLVNIPSVETRG